MIVNLRAVMVRWLGIVLEYAVYVYHKTFPLNYFCIFLKKMVIYHISS